MRPTRSGLAFVHQDAHGPDEGDHDRTGSSPRPIAAARVGGGF
jgi:hypothetical protein